MDYFPYLAPVIPAIWGITNIIDKYILVHKVKNVRGYIRVTGVVNLIYAIGLILLLDWQGLVWTDFILPLLCGLLFAVDGYNYFRILETDDACHMVGLVYTYPILLATMGYIFLGERIPTLGYFGIILTLIGVLWMSVRRKYLTFKTSVRLIIFQVFIVATYEFLAKVTTGKFTFLQGGAISMVGYSIGISAGLVFREVRAGFVKEMKNIKWAFFNESFTLMGTLALFFLMSRLPATVVGAVSATHPLFTLTFERIADSIFGKISKDHLLLPKLGAICLIVAGVAMMYLSGSV